MNRKLRRIQLGILAFFCAAVIVLAAVLTSILLKRANDTLQQYVSNLVAADSRQLQLNIETYLGRIEKTVSLLFSDKKYYEFDATDPSLSKYERIQAENAIEDEIVRLGLMDNYSDFGIVYSNDDNVGMISQVTTAMFPSGGLYQEFSSSISREKTMDGWSFGHQNNYDRLYYTKRLNSSAIAIVSFYSRELETVFELPEQLESMTIRLTDDHGQILYSSDTDEIGGRMDDGIENLIDSMDSSATVMYGSDLVTSNTCSNGWRVVCTISLEELMRNNRQLSAQMIGTVAAIAVIILLAGLLVYLWMGRSATGLYRDLNEKAEHDLMTDLLNKQTFEQSVSEALASGTENQVSVFLMFDLDNFKKVNDILGHAKGDEVVRKMADLLRMVLPDKFLIGRIGGDEFAAFAVFSDMKKPEVEEEAHALVRQMYSAFSEEFREEKEQTGLSVSGGVVTEDSEKYSFDELYRLADQRLYISKRGGKGRVTYEDTDETGNGENTGKTEG